MIRLMFTILLSFLTTEAVADVGDCTAKLVQEINYHATRAENLCNRASHAKTDLKHFGTCVSGIYSGTRIPPEIIAPYCTKRNDNAFRDCVISTYKSNSNDNAFKSCMKKKAPTTTVTRYTRDAKLRAPSSITINVL